MTFYSHERHRIHDHFDNPGVISYGRSVVTESVSLSLAVFEIMGPKHIGVTTMTFQGHVTSSIT